jgi:hypothetical protein
VKGREITPTFESTHDINTLRKKGKKYISHGTKEGETLRTLSGSCTKGLPVRLLRPPFYPLSVAWSTARVSRPHMPR